MSKPKVVGSKACPICKGYGDVWVNWHPTPVTCGHCDGTGKVATAAAPSEGGGE